MIDGKVKIFLAEDNPGDVFLVRMALEQSGLKFELEQAMDGEQAMRYLDTLEAGDTDVCPAFALLDLNLPRFDGKAVLGRLKSIPRCADVRTIVLTSSEYPLDRTDVEKLGADRYFHKPHDLTSYLRLGELVVELMRPAKV